MIAPSAILLVITVASLGVPVYSVSPNINPKKGVLSAGATAKLMVAAVMLKSTPGLSTTPLSDTSMANAVGGVKLTPPTVILNKVSVPLNVNESPRIFDPRTHGRKGQESVPLDRWRASVGEGQGGHGRRSEGSAVGRVGRVSEGVACRVARKHADKASKSDGVIAYRGQSSTHRHFLLTHARSHARRHAPAYAPARALYFI